MNRHLHLLHEIWKYHLCYLSRHCQVKWKWSLKDQKDGSRWCDNRALRPAVCFLLAIGYRRFREPWSPNQHERMPMA